MNEVIIIGAGLAGLSAAFQLSRAGLAVRVLEAKPYVGGRTASWNDAGMQVESGLHRVPAFYTQMLALMEEAEIDLDGALCWEDEVEVRIPEGPSAVYAVSLPRYPLRTLANVFGRNELCTLRERAALGLFFSAGLAQHALRPGSLDAWTVFDYARRFGVSERAIERLLVPMTEGLFFLHPRRYSAHVLFGLLAQGAKHPLRTGLAAFKGGMTDIMAEPIAQAIRRHGGRVETGCEVTELLTDGRRVLGVRLGDTTLAAQQVVLATSLAPAQALLRRAFGVQQWTRDLLELETMPSVTFQLELDSPSAPVDRMTFAPGTCMTTFSEQCRTTFPRQPGRLSVILSEPEKRVRQSPEELLAEVTADARRVGMELAGRVRNFRKVCWPSEFYYLTPGNDHLRPPQATPVQGLVLAGDYTRQPFLTTMEGAVIAGRRAAALILGAK